MARSAQYGILRIHSRRIDRIYIAPALSPHDESRLWHLMHVAIYGAMFGDSFDDNVEMRSKASEALVKIGAPAIGVLREQLSSYGHFDGPTTWYFVSERAADILKRIGEPAVPALIDGLCDKYEHTRKHALQALQELAGQTYGPDYELWRDWFFSVNRVE